MRLWTVHPKYLDAKGLVALWREGLLAKAVLEGKTRGYQNHPQLTRFRAMLDPHGFLCEYLREVLLEAERRGYQFNKEKLPATKKIFESFEESKGQLEYEWKHLLNKLAHRDMERFNKQKVIESPDSHPMFYIVSGGVQNWEKIS